jgi:uncharacterized protein (DUF952 family)
MQPAESIFHITSAKSWEACLTLGQYTNESLQTEGFIHFSGKKQIVGTANRYYQGQKGLVLLKVAVGRLAPELKYEIAPNGDLFPHLYGPLNLDAVEKVYPFEPEENGEFISLPE